MKQSFAETLQVISFKNDVYILQGRSLRKGTIISKSHIFSTILTITQSPYQLTFLLKMLLATVRRINLKMFASIGLVVFATQQHKTNTFSRLIIEIQL